MKIFGIPITKPLFKQKDYGFQNTEALMELLRLTTLNNSLKEEMTTLTEQLAQNNVRNINQWHLMEK
jgi:hypothetical protein